MMSPKRIALWFLIVSVAISAALGIIAILTGSFGDLEARIILTTLTISACSIGALASGALWENRHTKPLPLLGATLAILAAVLLIAGIWLEPSSDRYWKLTASVSVLATATAHACLLALARVARRFAWARLVTLAAIYLLAFQIVYIIYFAPHGDFGFRLVGSTAIIVAAFSVMMPIFHRLSRGDLDIATEKATATPHLFPTIACPRCGASQPNTLTETTCDQCSCRFVVTIVDNPGQAPGVAAN